MTEARRLAYLDALGLDAWVLRPPEAAHDRLVVQPGEGGTLLICELPDNTATRIAGDISIAFWMRKDTEAGDWVRLVGKGATSPRNYGVWEETGSGRRILFQQRDASFSNIVELYSATDIEVGQWYHVVAVAEGSTARLYIDGQLDAMGSRTGTPVTSADPVTIGHAGFHTFLNGALDDVRVYRRALSDYEAANLFRRGAPALPAPGA